MEKENIEQIQKKLDLSDNMTQKIFANLESFNNLQWSEENFKDMQNQIKLATILVHEFFKQNQHEFVGIKLSKLFSVLSRQQSEVQFIKKVFKNVQNVNFQQKKENPLFDEVYSIFTYMLLKYKAISQIEQKEKIPNQLIQKVWVFLCRLIQKINHQANITKEKISEISTSLIVKFIFIEFQKYTLDQALEKIPIFFGFELEKSKYQSTLIQISECMPQVNEPMPEIQAIENEYKESLAQFDLNYLHFSKAYDDRANTKSITLTPLVNQQENQKFVFGVQNFKNISFHSNLKRVVGVINFPEKQLKSPLLKEKFQSKVESFIEISQKFNWYKKFTQDIDMIILTIDQTNYKVAECCSQYLQIKKIRNNFHSVMKITQKLGIQPQRENVILKTFYKLLSKFMEQEFKKSQRERVQSLYEDDTFMKSLFCFCLVLDEFINYQNQDQFQKIIKSCDITYYYFWIILINFASEFGDQVSLAIKKFIIELDYKILFDYLWIENKEGKSEGNYLIDERPKHSVFIIEALIRKLGERIFLITNQIFLSDEIKEKIWILVKSIIFGNSNDEKQTIINFHLDKVVLLCIYYVSQNTQNQTSLSKILEVYKAQVLVPHDFNENELQEFYTDQFCNVLNKIQQNNENDVNSFLSPNEAQRSKERIHFIICSPLIDNLSPNLKKKDMSFYSSGTLRKKNKTFKIDSLNFNPSQHQSQIQSRKMSENQPTKQEEQQGDQKIPKTTKFSFSNLP